MWFTCSRRFSEYHKPKQFDLSLVEHLIFFRAVLRDTHFESKGRSVSHGDVRPASNTQVKSEVPKWLQSVSPDNMDVPVTNTMFLQERLQLKEIEFVKRA